MRVSSKVVSVGILALAAGIFGVALGADNLKERSSNTEIAALQKQVGVLEEQIQKLEDRLAEVEKKQQFKVLRLSNPQPEPSGVIPFVGPLQFSTQRLPKGSVPHEFNGMDYWMMPASTDSFEGRH